MSPEVVELIMTADDADWLGEFVGALVTDRMIACGNVSGPVRSRYRWEGKVEDQTEFRATLHTRASLVPDIVARIKAEHSYDVPAVIATPLIGGNDDYFAWVIAETDPPASDVS